MKIFGLALGALLVATAAAHSPMKIPSAYSGEPKHEGFPSPQSKRDTSQVRNVGPLSRMIA